MESNRLLLPYLFRRKFPSALRTDYQEYWRTYASGEELRYDEASAPAWLRPLSVRAGVVEAVAARLRAHGMVQGQIVVDAGCGDGMILEALSRRTSARLIGCDVAEEAVERLVAERGLEGFTCDFSGAWAVRNHFPECDFILAIEVLEHLPNTEEVLVGFGLKARRAVLASLPNTGHYFDRLRLLCGRFPLQWRYHPAEHLRYFTVKDFTELVRHLGFRVNALVPYHGIPFLREVWPNLFARHFLVDLSLDTEDALVRHGVERAPVSKT